VARSGLFCVDRMICAVVGGWLRKAVVSSRKSGFCLPQFCSGMRFLF